MLNSIIWGIFFSDIFEDVFEKILFGFLITLILMTIFGSFLIVIYKFDFLTISILLSLIPTLGYLINIFWNKDRLESFEINNSIIISLISKPITASLILYITLSSSCFYLIIISRRDIAKSIWEALHPAFIPIYVITTFLLCIIILSKEEEIKVKLSIISIHGFITLFIPFVLSLAPLKDPWIHLAKSRWVYITGHIPLYPYCFSYNPLYLPIPITGVYIAFRSIGQYVLTVIFTRMISTDVFVIHIIINPFLWSLLLPFISYIICFIVTNNRSVSILSSLFSISYYMQIIGGSWHAANYLGFLFIYIHILFLVMYINLKNKRYLILSLMSMITSGLLHYMTGVFALSFLILAFFYKNYKKYVFVIFSLCIFILPLFLYLFKNIYPLRINFSLKHLNNYSCFESVSKVLLGYFHSNVLTRKFFSGLILTLGILGLILLSKKTKKCNQSLSSFFFMVVFIVEFDYRILEFFMNGVPFSPERILRIGYFILLIFIVIPLESFFSTSFKFKLFLKKQKKRITFSYKTFMPFISIMITLIITLNMIEAYSFSSYKGLQPTKFELNVVKFIHESSNDHPYLVLSSYRFALIGASYVGYENVQARYYVISKTHRALINDIFDNIKYNQFYLADLLLSQLINVSYTEPNSYIYIVSSYNLNFDQYAGELLGVFKGPSEIGDIYVFRKLTRNQVLTRNDF